jgi:aspartate-semialdehyde dehydrogenase
MLVALKPIYDAVGISRINVATYQAVSGSGKRGVEALATETAKLLNAQPIEQDVYPQQIAFNAIPLIGDIQENGYSMEEMKMVWETRKIFEDESIEVNPTCVRIPVFFGHSEAVHIETKEAISAAQATELLASASGVEVIDERSDPDFPTPVRDAAGTDPVFVGRIRKDISTERGLNLWVVSDNVRKGAALNSIQIAEVLVKHLQ